MDREKKGSRKGLACLVFIFFIIALIGGGAFIANSWYDSAINDRNEEDIRDIEVTVVEGESMTQIAEDLEEKGAIKSALAVRIYLRLENLNPNIKPGVYTIPSNSTVPEIIALLETGTLKPSVTVTIKEGLRDDQIADELELKLQGTLFNKAEFTSIVENPDSVIFSAEVQQFLNTYKPAGKPLTGFLYPDTYKFDTDQTTVSIVETFLSNFITKVNGSVSLNSLNLTQSNITNIYDALILASVIEKEASKNDDRTEISSVFHNRLSEDYPLESDATVNFITKKNDPGVLISDTKIDSPYNTYMYAGLMPTPINNPRIDSIVAALYPKETTYFFFFHTDDGRTFYSETFAEHNQKVLQYRGSI